MVEPVPYMFERLRRSYSGVDRVTLENAEIADRDGEVAFYYFAEPRGAERDRMPVQYHVLGSMSREMLLRTPPSPTGVRRIVRAQVPCMTVESLLRRHGLQRLDLVAIDAEGYDCETVKQIDFDRIRRRVLVYEDAHIRPGERAECKRRLEGLGYETIVEAFDTCCLDARPTDSLTERWRCVRVAGPAVSREDLDRWFSAAGG